MSLEEIGRFFEPESVAVVGASRNPRKFGSMIVQNLQKLGYPGKLFIVNPSADQILGIESFPSVVTLPEKVDIVIIAVPAPMTPQVMSDCAQKGIKNVLIISSGFNEAGEAGQKRLDETLKIANRGKIRVIGPNTTGIVNTRSRFTTSFFPLSEEIKEGSVAFIAQTGMFAGALFHYVISSEHFGISKVIGLGNKIDVDETEILEYLYHDENTRVVMVYMEGVKDGRRFLQVAHKFTRTKPLVVLKGGRTPDGSSAAFSHTGSIAGRYSLIEPVFKQAGIILARDLEEMMDFASILAYQPIPQGPRVGIASISGGAAVMATDSITEAGLVLAPLSSEGLSKLERLLPDWSVAWHPLDLEPLRDRVGFDEVYQTGLEILLSDPNTDMCLLVMGVGVLSEAQGETQIAKLAPLLRKRNKPVVVSLIGRKELCEFLAARFKEMEVPAYLMVSRAAKSMAALYQYARSRRTNSD